MRTTIELKPEHRAKLIELAARRGEKGFSSVIADAIESHLQHAVESNQALERALLLRGRLSRKDADALRRTATALRNSWNRRHCGRVKGLKLLLATAEP